MNLLESFIKTLIKQELRNRFSKKTGMKERLNKFLELNEAKIDSLKQKYPQESDRIEFFRDIPQKYIEWVAKNISTRPKSRIHDWQGEDQELKQAILDFDELARKNQIKNKDINSYNVSDWEGFLKFVNDIKSNTQSKTSQKKEIKKNSTLIWKDDRYTIIQPHDMNASCYYGYNTKWCISAKEENYFDRYTKQGAIFYFIMDKQPADPNYAKVALAVFSQKFEIYNSEDTRMSQELFMELYPKQVLDALNPFVNDAFSTAEEKVIKQQQEIQKLDQLSDKEFINKIDEIARIAHEEQRYSEENESIPTYNFILRIIDEISLEKISLMYDILFNNEVAERLIKENINVDTLLSMTTKSFSYFKYNKDYIGHDIYHRFIIQRNYNADYEINMDDVIKLFQYNIKGEHPYRYEALNVVKNKLTKQLGLYSSDLQAWFHNANFRNSIKNIVKEPDPAKQDKLIHDIFEYTHIGEDTLNKVIELYKKGQLPDDPDQFLINLYNSSKNSQ